MPLIYQENNNDLTSTSNPEVRQRMKDYWVKHSKHASMEEMLLDSNASTISDNELPEILSILPSFKNKNVLELGAGIGRFTSVLAKQANSVTAVDFIQNFIEKNRDLNSSFNNIEFVHGDVTKLTFKPNHYDMIFSNWLLMYLGDEEVQKFVVKSLKSLKPGGCIFFRESCFHASGDIKKVASNDNPTNYRSPNKYVDTFLSQVVEENGQQYGFELIFARPSRTYIELKNNANQVCFLFNKVKLQDYHGFKSFQEFLDHKQYSLNGVLRYEKIFGDGFVSTGGKRSTEEFLPQLDLKPNQVVLDVGCGIGGGDFMMAERYGVEVIGIDLSTNMIGVAWDRMQQHKHLKVTFEVGDIVKHEYPAEYFDVIYSRDTILHIEDKKALFNRFKYWLKPGGKVFITDYCCGPKPWSPAYTSYVEQRGYCLLTVPEYGNLFKELGYTNVRAEDVTDKFLNYLSIESAEFESMKDKFVKEFSQQDFDYILNGWKEKIVRSKQGHQRWGLFYAEKK